MAFKGQSLLSYIRVLVSLTPHQYPPHSHIGYGYWAEVRETSTLIQQYLFILMTFLIQVITVSEEKNLENENKKLEKKSPQLPPPRNVHYQHLVCSLYIFCCVRINLYPGWAIAEIQTQVGDGTRRFLLYSKFLVTIQLYRCKRTGETARGRIQRVSACGIQIQLMWQTLGYLKQAKSK